MKIQHKIDGDILIFYVSGRFMGGAESQEGHDLLKMHLDEGFRKYIYDVSKIEWISSAGLGLFIASFASIQKHKGVMVMVGVTEKLKSLLTISKIVDLFKQFNTLEEAKTHLSTCQCQPNK